MPLIKGLGRIGGAGWQVTDITVVREVTEITWIGRDGVARARDSLKRPKKSLDLLRKYLTNCIVILDKLRYNVEAH